VNQLDRLAAAAHHSYAISVELAQLAVEVGRITLGRSEEAPARNDRRFADPALTSNPVFKRIAQTQLASAAALQRIAEDLGDGASAERARFAVDVLTSAWAPNFVLTNPAAIKRAFDTGGMSLARGVRNYLSDLRHNDGMPSMVERDAFEVGRDLAVTPGAVAARDGVAELLQYSPTTETVYERPVLVVPPPIGRFYFLDLAPGRSFVEYAVSRGLQTFMMSWRNPTAGQGDWDLDPGTPTAPTCPARCTASSSTLSRTTCSPCPARQASQARSSCGAGEAGSRRRVQKARNARVRPGQPPTAFRRGPGRTAAVLRSWAAGP
jgi:polyhydroxyalkanoate synthase subunit PhaC